MTRRFRLLTAGFAVVWLAACGSADAAGESGLAFAEPEIEEPAPDQPDIADAIEAPADSTTTSLSPLSPTTTTTTVPLLPEVAVDDAIAIYDRHFEATVPYLNALYIDRNATLEQARAFVAMFDPSLIAVDEAAVLELHNCFVDTSLLATAFELTGFEIEIEHLEQQPVNATTWALQVRQFVRYEGFSEIVTDQTILVTNNGVGPTVLPQTDEPGCVLPWSDVGAALVAEAIDVLGAAERFTSSDEP